MAKRAEDDRYLVLCARFAPAAVIAILALAVVAAADAWPGRGADRLLRTGGLGRAALSPTRLGTVLAAYLDNGYKLMLVLHILAAVVAFGPLFALSALQRAGRTSDVAKMYLYMCLPALVLTWVFGMGLVGMSKPEGSSEAFFKMSQTWIVLALIGWLIAVVVGAVLIRPALTDNSADARKKLSAGLGVTHLLLIIILYLMTFKPGL